MSWKKHFTVYNNTNGKSSKNSRGSVEGYNTRFQSWLPEVYSGMPNRIERYMQYDQMDMDVEINMALDTIAEFSTQIDEETELPFTIKYKKEPTDTETKVLNKALSQWCNINEWDKRIFKTFRNVIKYGDQPFIRDPETWELMYVNPQDVTGVVINESEGKNPAQYILRNLDLNLQDKTATTPIAVNRNAGSTTQSPFSSARTGASTSYNTNVTSLNTTQEEYHVDSSNVIHVALSEGMDANYPFGNSILDSVFKTYKQKELLEDALIIYRVQRAPERRVFYIDTGDMPPHRAAAFLEKMKMEVHQKRIPNKTGGGSSIMDAQYNPMCLTLDTKIPLLDGRTLELNELISEYQNGKENWAYSCDPETGKIVPGVITWAGVTRKNAEVIKLTFDNGKTLTVTPDHKIPVFGKGFVEAQNLTPEDSLISFETRFEKLPSSDNDTTYTQVFDHKEKEWKFVHRLVAGYFRRLNQHQEFTYILEGNKNAVHHKDFNRYNNDPRNLQWMNAEDHFKFNGDTNFWNSITPEETDRVKNKIRKTLQDRWNNLSNEQREKELNKILDNQKKAVWSRQNEPVYKENYRKNARASRLKFLEKNPNFIKDVYHKNTKTDQENYPNQNKNYSFRMLQIIAETVRKHNSNKKETIQLLSNNQEFLNEIKVNNPSDPKNNCKTIHDKVTNTTLDKTLWHFGYKGWSDFKEKLNVFNHRLVKIEYLDNTQDTGTITIDGNERWHDYHTFATNSGIFVKNSILEDYFFNQTSEGRGSKVEVLPGGQSLGEIEDLLFFSDKLMRGLRVPNSYMPQQSSNDSGMNFTDGRVGTAFIQEFRFNKYCLRLQNTMQPVFDREFKRFMKNRGFNIDSSMFELQFPEPQSFSDYRQIELDSAKAGVFAQLEGVDYLSRRFILKKYLGLSDSEILENERLYQEENPEISGSASESGMDDIGLRGGDDFDEDIDLENMGDDFGDDEGGLESPISGAEGAEETPEEGQT